ncbi:MAG TPA: YciI family protein [Polyangiaceae bacterium]|nr:YciI family protein [Polyangiaceae bacterium]
MTYTLLIYRTALASMPIPEKEERAALAGHRALQAETEASGELHAVARLDDPSTARTVKRRVGAHDVSDGPYIETKEWLVGIYLLECENEEQALARARLLAQDSAHVIEVRPVTWRKVP